MTSIYISISMAISGKVSFLFHPSGIQSLKDDFRYGTWETGKQDNGVGFGSFGN